MKLLKDYTQMQALDLIQKIMIASNRVGGKGGFRHGSKKNGPIGQLTYVDQVMVRAIGPDAFPKASRSERKRIRAQRRLVYLENVRFNPRYPSGDTRLKQGRIAA